MGDHRVLCLKNSFPQKFCPLRPAFPNNSSSSRMEKKIHFHKTDFGNP